MSLINTGWVGFVGALQHARELLDDAATKRPLGVEWYLVSSRVALGQGWSDDQSEKLFQGAIAQDSTCENAYIMRAFYLLPRWNGKPGAWEAWLDKAVAPLPPAEADRVYAAVCDRLSGFHRDLFEETSASWPRMWRGYQVQLARHPKSQALAQTIAFNASLAGDIPVAHEMLRRTGPRCDLEIWRSKETFTDFYIWVQARSANRTDVKTASMQ